MKTNSINVERLVKLRDYLNHRVNVYFPDVINDEDTPKAMRMAYEGKLDEARWIIAEIDKILDGEAEQ
jgi:hypothetical protein